MSDKSFKETIKDVELSSYRSTTKEGYVSLDPSKPLPHEYEEGKLSRYSDNSRQKYVTRTDVDGATADQPLSEHEAKIVSQFANASKSVFLNKTEFREILMNALNINNTSSITKGLEMSIEPKTQNQHLKRPKKPEIKHSYDKMATSTDEVIYANQSIEKPTKTSDSQKKSNSISLDTPEVDKLLNEGNFPHINTLDIISSTFLYSC